MTWLLFLSPDFFLIPPLLVSPSSHFPSSSLTPARLYSLFSFVSPGLLTLSKSDFFIFLFASLDDGCLTFPSLSVSCLFLPFTSPLDADKSHLFHQVFMGVDEEEMREELPHSRVCVVDDVWRLQHSGPAGGWFSNSSLSQP